MPKGKLSSAIMLFAVMLFLSCTAARSFALGYNFGGFSSPPPVPTPIFITPGSYWYPHGFARIWSADEVVKVFNNKNLEVVDPEVMTETEQFGLPADVNELIKFLIPSIGSGIQGCILSFELKENLNKTIEYYIDLNDKGQPYTWSFLKDNILLVIDGVVPEEKARQYESALADLNQK